MSHRLPGPTMAMLLRDIKPALPFVSARSRIALDQLCDAFDEGRTLVVLNSGWTSGASHLIRQFLAQARGGVAVARVTESSSSEIDGMRELIRSVGFDAKEKSIADLEKVFINFLSIQRKRNRRTLVVVEDSGNNGGWMRDRVSRLIKLEAEGNFGLTVILARQTKLEGLADEAPLDELSYRTGKHISLSPFTKAETRKFIRWRIDAADSADIGRILDFQAIILIHELCDGVPDAIDRLCCASLELADEEDTAPVTTDIVMRASKKLRLQPMTRQPDAESSLKAGIPTLRQPEAAKIILTYKGRTLRELTLGQQRLSIGRSTENDLCINSTFVSRQHAAIFRNGAETAIVDLESTNGTYVNSRRIQVQTITDQDEIAIGYHGLRFVDRNASNRVSLNGVAHNGSARTKRPRIVSAVLASTGNPPVLRKSAADSD